MTTFNFPLQPQTPEEGMKPAEEDKNPFALYNAFPIKSSSDAVVYEDTSKYATQEELDEAQKKIDEKVGFTEGLKHSWLGEMYQKVHSNLATADDTGYTPTDEEQAEALDKLGWDYEAYANARRYSLNREEFLKFVDLNTEHKKYRDLEAKASLSDRLASGLGGATPEIVGSLILPITGGSGIVAGGTRIALSAIGAGVNEAMNWYATGEDPEILENMALGAVFAGGIEGVFNKTLKGGTKTVAESMADFGINQARRTSQWLGTNKYSSPFWNPILNTIQKVKENAVLSVTGAIDNAKGTPMEYVWGSLTKLEKGYSVKGETGVHKQFLTGNANFTEMLQDIRTQGYLYYDRMANNYNRFLDTHKDLTDLDLSHEIRKVREGGKSKYSEDSHFKFIVEDVNNFYKMYHNHLTMGEMIDGFINPKLYEHRRYNGHAVDDFIQSCSGANLVEKEANAVRAISNDFIHGVMASKEHLDDFKRIYQEEVLDKIKTPKGKPQKFNNDKFMEWLKTEAEHSAYGVVDRNEAIKRRLIESPSSKVGRGNDYQQARRPWNTAWENSLGWSIDRLQADIMSTMNGYHIRASADVALNKTFGVKSFEDYQTLINDKFLKQTKEYTTNPNFGKGQLDAMKAFFDGVYCRTGIDSADKLGTGMAVYESLRNIAYVGKNAMIGIMNFFETAEAFKAWGGVTVLKALPLVGKNWRRICKKGLSQADHEYINAHLFGQDTRVRDSFREISKRNLERYDNPTLAKMVSGTEWFSSHSPFSKFVNYAQNSIIDEARSQAFADLVRVSKKKGSVNLMNDARVRERLNISPRVWKKVKDALNRSTNVDGKGAINIRADDWEKRIANDAEVRMAIRRFGDYVASEVIQRRDFTDVFISPTMRTNPWIQSLLFFKTFAIRSYNHRLAKMGNRIGEGDLAGQAGTFMISGALGFMNFALNTAAVASGMTEEQRKNYLTRVMGVESLDKMTWEGAINCFINGGMRSSLLAAPALVASMTGFKPELKTTASIDYNRKDRPVVYIEPADFITQNMPIYSTIQGVIDGTAQGVNYMVNKNQMSRSDIQKTKRNMANDMRKLLPNVPFFRDYLIETMVDKDKY